MKPANVASLLERSSHQHIDAMLRHIEEAQRASEEIAEVIRADPDNPEYAGALEALERQKVIVERLKKQIAYLRNDADEAIWAAIEKQAREPKK